MVVGLDYRTAPVAMRERFSIGENRRYEALLHLSRAEGIEEVVILATSNRTEFLLWSSDITLAANSVMRFLATEFALQLCEWKNFYRLLDEVALLHIFRVASGLDAMVVGAPETVSEIQEAWQQAQKVGASGRFLDAVLQKALAVSDRVRTKAATAEAEQIIHAEAQGFRCKLTAERVVPTIVALRQRLDEICRQELDSFRQEIGPFSHDQDEMLSAMMSRMTQRIAASLARELRGVPEKQQQDQMTVALQRLFHLPTAEPAIAGTKSA